MDRMIDRVRRIMLDNQWRSLDYIASTTGGKRDSVSSLMRQLRNPKHGGFNVEKRYDDIGVWVYRIAPALEIKAKPTPPVKRKPATDKDKKPPLTDAEKIARAIMVGVFSRLVSK
jgi:hypothetical protein